jgi:hypothetical protein
MMLAAARRRVAAWRQPRSAARAARVLWVAWAVVVWNVVLDHVIVVAGRDYIAAARRAAAVPGGPFANMDDWMRPAVTRGFWIATAAGASLLIVGLAAVNWAERRSGRPALREPPRGVPSRSRDERLSLQDHSR